MSSAQPDAGPPTPKRKPRRWAFAVGAIVFVIGAFAFIDPYTRQSLYGPAPNGVPWCAWEDAVRNRFPGQHESWLRKTFAAIGIRRQPIDAPVPVVVLHHLADDADVKLRRYVLQELRHRTDATSIPLFDKHIADEDAECRLTAKLGLLKTARLIWKETKRNDLKKWVLQLHEDEDNDIRFESALALVEMTTERREALDTLATFAKDSQYLPIRRDAVSIMLASFSKAEDQLDLAMRFIVDPDPEIRAQVFKFMTGPERSLRGLQEINIGPILAEAIQDSCADVRYAAISALRLAHRIEPGLFERFSSLTRHEKRDVRCAAIGAMKHFGKRSVTVLRAALRDSDPTIRESGIATTEYLQDDGLDLIPDLVWILSQPDNQIHRHRAGQHAAVLEILSAAAQRNENCRTELFQPIVKAAKDGNPRVRCRAVKSMGHFGKKALPIVEAGLLDADEDVCWNALDAAAALGKDAIPLVPVILRQKTRFSTKAWYLDQIERTLRLIGS